MSVPTESYSSLRQRLTPYLSTPSVESADPWQRAARAMIERIAEGGPREDHVNFLPGRLGREDLKYLGEILVDFDLRSIQYPNMRDAAGERAGRLGLPSGARAAELRRMGGARATLEFALASRSDATAGRLLAERFGVPRVDVALPIGVAHTDQFFDALERLSGRATPRAHVREREQVIEAFLDAPKLLAEKRAVVFGEESMAAGLVSLLAEMGITPVVCAADVPRGRLRATILEIEPELAPRIAVFEGRDFAELEERAAALEPDLIVGGDLAYALSKSLELPLVWAGLDEEGAGGAGGLCVGYRGARRIFDEVARAVAPS